MDFGLPGPVNPVKKRSAFTPYRYNTAIRFSDQFFFAFTGKAAKGGVDIPDDVVRSLHCGYRHGRAFGDGPAETRQVELVPDETGYARSHFSHILFWYISILYLLTHICLAAYSVGQDGSSRLGIPVIR
jgi:hypothetical protein